MDRKVRVNVISPGNIDTNALAQYGEAEEEVGVLRQIQAAKIPMKRLGRAEEIARAALFLASDDSSFTTGQELFVDGGAVDIGSTQLR